MYAFPVVPETLRKERIFSNRFTCQPMVSQGYALSMEAILPIAISLVKTLPCVKEVILPAGFSDAVNPDTNEQLRLKIDGRRMSWYHHDLEHHHAHCDHLLLEYLDEHISIVKWYQTALEESLIPKGNRLFKRYVSSPNHPNAEPPMVEFYALVDHTSQRDIFIYRKAFVMDTEDTLLFTLDSTAVKGQYVILPN